ncbi:hypothetical protein Tsubulata_003021 [Turnera subulata]|uniref:Uncharacterized protein n=1 Tax=Turnera subulata TaxID=218843 RepID=A0A9Q0G1N6_9ROSI|nr:hypothetical protein Tsubulata_003021 [Turnera subulata]
MSEDEWVRVAIGDDALVVHMLLELSRAREKHPPPPPLESVQQPPLLRWSVRQRRSKQRKKSAPDSPTTPLSRSGGTSGSGGGDGLSADGGEESSSPSAAGHGGDTSRSEMLAELKEEESLLFKESINLETHLATLRLSLEQQRSANQKLKRIKLDLLARQMTDEVTLSANCVQANFDELQKIKLAPDAKVPVSNSSNVPKLSTPSVSFQYKEDEAMKPAFILPDLNLPVENDSSPDVLYGLS